MQAGILFDNGGTVFLSAFISLWAVTFHEHWKRCCAFQAYRWDCSDIEEIEVLVQPTIKLALAFTSIMPFIKTFPQILT